MTVVLIYMHQDRTSLCCSLSCPQKNQICHVVTCNSVYTPPNLCPKNQPTALKLWTRYTVVLRVFVVCYSYHLLCYLSSCTIDYSNDGDKSCFTHIKNNYTQIRDIPRQWRVQNWPILDPSFFSL